MIATGNLVAAAETPGALMGLAALSAAFDDMASTAGRFDGAYELARDRFNAVAGKEVGKA